MAMQIIERGRCTQQRPLLRQATAQRASKPSPRRCGIAVGIDSEKTGIIALPEVDTHCIILALGPRRDVDFRDSDGGGC